MIKAKSLVNIFITTREIRTNNYFHAVSPPKESTHFLWKIVMMKAEDVVDREELKLVWFWISDAWPGCRRWIRHPPGEKRAVQCFLVWFILDLHSWSSPEERALEHGSCALSSWLQMPEILACWTVHSIHPRPSGWHASHFLCFWLETEVQTSCVCNFTSLWVLFFLFLFSAWQCMFLG